MAIENETGFMSLADLAAYNTDDIAVLTSRLPDEGIFLVRGEEVKAAESEARTPGEPPLFSFTFHLEVLEAAPLDKSKDPESYVGKKMRDRYVLWPSDFSEAIGLLRGRYQLVGLPNTGALGGLEGAEPGWLDGVVGHIFRIRVRHWTAKDGSERAQFDWLPQEEKESAEA